jgi:hypothetical protein
MKDYVMSQLMIPLSPLLYGRYQRIAEEENRALEDVINEALESHLKQLDEDLWAIVNQRLSPSEDTQLHELLAKGNAGTITETEKIRLQSLVEEVNRQMAERTEALAQLQERGYDVKSYLNTWRDDSHT